MTAAVEVDHVIDPATGSVITEIPSAGPDDVAHAVDVAATAFPAWARTTPRERSELLLELANRVEARATELGELESRNAGKPITAMPEEIDMCVDTLRFFAGAARTMDGRAGGRVPRGPHVVRAPRPARRRRRDHAVELPADDGGVEGRPGDRRRQHAHPQAVRAHPAHDHRARRASPRSCCRPACCRSCAGAARPPAPRSSPTHASRSISFTGSVNTGRAVAAVAVRQPDPRPPRARGQGAGRGVRRRGSRGAGRSGRDGRVRQRGPGLHRVVPGAREPAGARRRRGRPRRGRPRAAARRSARRGDGARAGDLTGSARPGGRDGRPRPATPAPGSRPAVSRPTAAASSTSRRSSSTRSRTPRSCSARSSDRW